MRGHGLADAIADAEPDKVAYVNADAESDVFADARADDDPDSCAGDRCVAVAHAGANSLANTGADTAVRAGHIPQCRRQLHGVRCGTVLERAGRFCMREVRGGAASGICWPDRLHTLRGRALHTAVGRHAVH